MRHSLFLAAALLLLLALGAPALGLENPARNVTPEQAAEIIKNDPSIYILDVRTPGEFGQGHLQGAHNLDFWGAKFDQELEKLPRDKPILFYCRTGRRSAEAGQAFARAGYDNLVHLEKGIEAWQAAGLPVVKD